MENLNKLLLLACATFSVMSLVKSQNQEAVEEIIHVTRSNILDICLVKTGTSTPMISAIELRPMRYDTYTARTGSLKIIERTYFANSDKLIRYVNYSIQRGY
ncbi:hypothetical protein ARALYDRAFT_899652 [Arabidopsis lyrata subsp. lyrata]|uniref:Malectin-like domain-containing protein n=1 Tax=Arabidopsis lyrata subsp. lyrata TaxID=81972 RepID=D7L1T2_ARALL|nr:hypothetical protein ARALYDRAFT_899652 [Arabidopsis lyrata subsp. lyrata]